MPITKNEELTWPGKSNATRQCVVTICLPCAVQIESLYFTSLLHSAFPTIHEEKCATNFEDKTKLATRELLKTVQLT